MYTWDLPTKVLFGAGKLNELHKEKLPGRKALLVISNGKSCKVNGSFDRTVAELKKAGCEVEVFDKVQANPLSDTLDEGVEKARATKCEFVVGLGGGSVLDAVTVIAAVAPNEGKVWDYIVGGTGLGKPLTKRSLPYIEITTSAGTGSEVDRWGVVTNPATHEKIGFLGAFADIAVVDPELMLTVPADFTAYQGFDALFHSVEGYFSKRGNIAAEMVQLEAIRNIARYLPVAVSDGGNIEARSRMAFANTLSGYSMELSSCVSEHSLEHAMSAYHQALPHGAGLIMISVAYFTVMIEKGVCPDRFVELARALGKDDASVPADFITALKRLQRDCGVEELKMSDYGITPDEFTVMARNAKSAMGGLFECDRMELTEEDVVDIYARSYR